jgi:1-acyl-sn-glycerol-3-phosphate acyltransferase
MALTAVLTAGLGLSLTRLNYGEDISAFLPDEGGAVNMNALYRAVGNSDKIMLYFQMRTVRPDSTGHIIAAIDFAAEQLALADTAGIIPEITARVDEGQALELTGFVRRNAPYFLTDDDYRRLDTLLTDDYAAACLSNAKRMLLLPTGGLMQQSIASDPLNLFAPLLNRLQNFRPADGDVIDGHLFMNGGRKGMCIVTTPYSVSETNKSLKLLELINCTLAKTEAEFPDIKTSCFGAPAIAVTNARQIKSDSILSMAIATVLLLILLVCYFRNLRNIILIFVSVAFGWLFALAILAQWKDSLSVIAIATGSIFIGIAINYPLHLLGHLREQPDMREALREITPPLLTGNITTVGAFLSLAFIPSEAMRDMGLFGALLLVGTILFVLLVLPHLVRKNIRRKSAEDSAIISRPAPLPKFLKRSLLPLIALTVLFLHLSRFMEFDTDMNNINYMSASQRSDLQELLQATAQDGMDAVYFVTSGGAVDDALAAAEANRPLLDSLHRAGLWLSEAGIGQFLPSGAEQRRRLERWNSFCLKNRGKIESLLEKYGAQEGFRRQAFHPFCELLTAQLAPESDDFFAPIATFPAKNYLLHLGDKTMVINILRSQPEHTGALVDALREKAVADAVAFDSRSISRRLVDSLSDEFNFVLYICGFIVLLFLTLTLGRLELSMMAFIPLVVSWIWIPGIMLLSGLQFNIVNIILATFIFGQGDDYTIFMTEGLMYEYTYRRRMLGSYRKSIVISALIMFIGIGTLILARHPALRSLAEVIFVGMFTVVLMACLIPPLLFKWLTQNRHGWREVPLTFRRLASSLWAFAVFLVGSLFITVSGFFLLGTGRRTEKRKLLYHKILRKIADFVIHRVPGVRFSFLNPDGEKFEKPAVIISNHQSHLDLMCIMRLTPKIIILTNEWVWNSPFYGRLIKYADFFPVSSGMESMLPQLADRIANGYSIVVFPEGTRSESCEIKRFHIGAFVLAQQLNVDVVQVMLHGVGHVLPKHDFMLRQGAITVEVHPRIPAQAMDVPDIRAFCSNVRKFYVGSYHRMAQRLETAAYFRSFVLHNYIYKGFGIERKVRILLRKHDCYAQWIDSYTGSSDGKILVRNNGIGVFSFLFALVHKDTKVIACDTDPGMVALAAGCAGIPRNLHIEHAEYCHTAVPASSGYDCIYDMCDDMPIMRYKSQNT